MMASASTIPEHRTLADMLRRLGDVSPSRVRAFPAPGTATKNDLLQLDRKGRRLCELVDGVLLEKAMGWTEAILAATIIRLLGNFVSSHNLGLVAGPDGTIELWEGLVRIPDVAFISWARLPGGKIPADPIPNIAPDLAVEVVSRTNSEAELQRKRAEYFQAGVRQVWVVDHHTRTVHIYESAQEATLLGVDDTLRGGAVLPGFEVAVGEIFAELDRREPA
ncbi:MAG: Uma2 family endonuclease [Planctomycetales bacterium]|nr:Uma2 family endonuclease [Planctomycetales bacterium]